jgi:hypothetical protein
MGSDMEARGELTLSQCWHSLRSFVARRPVEIILGLGIAVRVAQFLSDRNLWMDESSLAANLQDRSPLELLGRLSQTQLAPPVFLLLEWLARRTLGFHNWSLRLLPLCCGIASLFLFDKLSRHYLKPSAALIALALFAVSDDLIYFASELKPYSCDVTVALACSLMGVAMAAGPLTIRRTLGFGALGALAVWCSYPALFVLAGIGSTLFASALLDRDWRRAGALALVGVIWLASFAGLYRISMTQLGHSGAMWSFWAGVFPPMPTEFVGTLVWALRRFLYLFVNPLNFANPLDPRFGVVPALLLFLIGSITLARRDVRSFAMIALPGLFALLASGLRMYPFHGRLSLFEVPFLLLPIAAGAGWLRERGARGLLWALILCALFLLPGLDALYCVFSPRDHGSFNPYGDRRSAKLDPTSFPF